MHKANAIINPVLKELKTTTFFRLFKVNFEKTCPFWNEKMLCDSNKCGVYECDDNEVPEFYEKDKNTTL